MNPNLCAIISPPCEKCGLGPVNTMPGGIGPVDPECAKALCRSHREIRLPASADEVQIFYNLSMDRVHYVPGRDAVYFVESSHVAVQAIILSVMHSLRTPDLTEKALIPKPTVVGWR